MDESSSNSDTSASSNSDQRLPDNPAGQNQDASVQKTCVIGSEEAQLALQRIRHQRRAAAHPDKDEAKKAKAILTKLGSLLHLQSSSSSSAVSMAETKVISNSPPSEEGTVSTIASSSSTIELTPFDEREDCFLITAIDFVEPFQDILQDMMVMERQVDTTTSVKDASTSVKKPKKSKKKLPNFSFHEESISSMTARSGSQNTKKGHSFHRNMPILYKSNKKTVKCDERSLISQRGVENVPLLYPQGSIQHALTCIQKFLCCEGVTDSRRYAATPIQRVSTNSNTIAESVEAGDYMRSHMDSMELSVYFDESTLDLCSKNSLNHILTHSPQTRFEDDDMMDGSVPSRPGLKVGNFVDEDMASFKSSAAKIKKDSALCSTSVSNKEKAAATSIQSRIRGMLVRQSATRDYLLSFQPTEIIETKDLVVAFGTIKQGNYISGSSGHHVDTIETVLLLDDMFYPKQHSSDDDSSCPEIRLDDYYRQDSFSTLTPYHSSVYTEESDLDFQLKMLEEELDDLNTEFEEITAASSGHGESKLDDFLSKEGAVEEISI